MSETVKSNRPSEVLLSAQDVADRYGVPLQTVRGWRTKGYGPVGFPVGRYVRYRLSECIAFEEKQLQQEAAS